MLSQVRTYANGMLYSVLHREAIRDAARERGLGDFLQMVAANSEEVFARQIRYIQMQLGSEVSDRDDAPSGDEEEFEDIDEEGEDVDGDEADEYEATEHLLPKGTLRGEELLCQGYLADIVAAEQEEVMMRESMDIALATMNMAKHMQGGSLGASMRSSAVFASLAGEVLQRPATPLTFNASIRSNAAAIEPPLERSATSHERRHQPPSSSQHRRTASASSSGPRGSDRDLRNRDRERDRERGDTSRAEGKAIATSSSSSVSRAEKSGERSNRSSSSSSRRPPSSSLPSQAPPRRSSNAEPTSSRSHVRTPDSEALLRHPKPASRSGLGSSSRSRRVSGTDTAARAEQEVAARRTKNASELRRDDPGGYQGKERATQDHMQAFGKGQEIPRTPSTRGSQR